MADLTSIHSARLLGFAPRAGVATLQAALSTVPGPALWSEAGDEVVALLQPEPQTPLVRRGRKALLEGLHTVQRRLELACQAGPFLPMDPAAATAQAETIMRLLRPAWAALSTALARHGATQQWDVVLRWSPEPVVAAHRAELAEVVSESGKAALADAVAGVLRTDRAAREAALIAALTPAVLALAPPAGSETEVALTVLVPRFGEAVIETALAGLSGPVAAGAEVDLRGPLPPLSFHAARLATVEQGEVASAWRRLDLPDQVDAKSLHQKWRQRAAAVHPDRAQGTQTLTLATLSDVTDAYRTLVALLPETGSATLPELLRRAGYRLVLPIEPMFEASTRQPSRASEPAI